MKRSEFLQSVAVLLGAACQPPPAPPQVAAPAAPPPAPPPAAPPPKVMHYKHWAWLTANHAQSDDAYKREFERMAESGVSVVLAEAFNGTEAFYASAHLPTTGDWLGRILPLAEAAQLDVYAWAWCMPCSVESVVAGHKDWFMVNQEGMSTADKPVYVPQDRFLCPTRPEVREFLKQRMAELVKYPVTGVHLDYIQFPQVILPAGLQTQYGIAQEAEMAAYDYCYCEVCRGKFKQQTDIDPKNFNQPSASDIWRQFRYDQLSELVNQVLVPTIRQADKRVSAAVLPDWEQARQDYGRWQLDAALPLLYHGLYDEDLTWVGFQTQQSIERLAQGTGCISTLLVSHLSPPDLTGAVRMAIESGATGIGLYSGQAMSPLHWQAFQRASEEAEAGAGSAGTEAS